MTASTGTVKLHRVFRSAPEKIYRAFLEPAAKCKWLPPYGFTGTVHASDVRVGGKYKMSFTDFSTGQSHSFGGEYIELTSNSRIRYHDQFDDPNLPGVMEVTIELKPVACGTEVFIEQSGIPAAIPVEFCYVGWQESLILLGQLVEVASPE